MKKTTRKKIIQDKIFIKENIRSLWSKIKSEHSVSQQENNHSSLVMSSSLVMKINCNDGISYESETNDLIQDGDIIDIKKCSTISIEYIDYKLGRRINLDLSRGNEHYGNDLIVQGDNDWVAGTFGTLNDIIDSVKPQEHWFIKYQRLILFGGIAVFIYLPTRLDLIFTINLDQVVWIYVVFIMVSPLIISFLIDWTRKLWLSVEFDFGPDHQKTEKNRRYRIGLFFSVIILPLIWSLI